MQLHRIFRDKIINYVFKVWLFLNSAELKKLCITQNLLPRGEGVTSVTDEGLYNLKGTAYAVPSDCR